MPVNHDLNRVSNRQKLINKDLVFSSFRIGVRPVLEILEYNPNNTLNINTLKNKVLDLQNRIIIQNRMLILVLLHS